jgi:hypothetical protein
MANTLTTQALEKGAVVILHFYLASDGSTGDMSNTSLFTASTYGILTSKVSLLRVQSCLAGFSAILSWHASSDVPFLVLPKDKDAHFEYGQMANGGLGGIKDNASTGADGTIDITTVGMTATSNVGHITLWLRVL